MRRTREQRQSKNFGLIQENDIYFSEESRNDTSEVTKETKESLAYSKKKQSSENDMPIQNASKLSESTLSKQQSSNLQGMPKDLNPAQQSVIEVSLNSKGDSENVSRNAGNNPKPDALAQDQPVQSERNSLSDWLDVATDFPTSKSNNTSDLSDVSKEPNKAQKQAIETDINSNIRVIAGPGSGKTFIIEYRYNHLVQNGVKPSNILVCTFGKDSSTDMANRIQKTCPDAEMEQISTINALCSRLLTKWDGLSSKYYKWQVPLDWKVKSEIESLIDRIWSGEKPAPKEILDKINLSKAQGLTPDDSYAYFIDIHGSKFGNWLYEIRSAFDAWLTRNRYLTFADQLYLVEQWLKNDEMWRTGLQEKFSHVIIDEVQDTTYQAMRILVTISLEPGMNTVYEEK